MRDKKMVKSMVSRKKWFPFLVILILLLAGYLFFIRACGGEGGLSLDRGVQVSRLVMDGPQGRVLIERDDAAGWMVDGQDVGNVAAINDLVTTMRRQQVRGPVSVLLRDAVMKQMDEGGTSVSVYAARSWLPWPVRVGSWVVGGDTPDGKATYMADRRGEVYEVHVPGLEMGLAASYDARTHLWISPLVLHLKADEIREVTLAYPGRPEDGFTLKCHGGNGYVLYKQDGEPFAGDAVDELAIDRFLSSFTGLAYERLLPGSSDNPPEDLLSSTPFLAMRVETWEGEEHMLGFYRRRRPDNGTLQSPTRAFDVNRFYLKSGHGDYAMAQYFVFQWVIRDRSFFKTSGCPSAPPS